MITITKRQAVYILVALAAIYVWNGGRLPGPTPPQDRPILRAIAKIAKTFLWVAVFAEGPPPESAPQQMVRAHIGEDGHPTLEHGRGW